MKPHAFLPVSVAFSHSVNVTLVCEPEAAWATDKHAGSQTGGPGGGAGVTTTLRIFTGLS